MHRWLSTVLAAAALLAFAARLSAGGFWVTLGNPEASPEARAMHAVATFQAIGCHRPEKAELTARAVGVVNGERRSIPLKLAALPAPGMYALTRQWPAEGRWVIEVVATSQGAVTSTLAPAGPAGVDRDHARLAMARPAVADLDALLDGR
jgi:hypothetical protein